jgi:hypothetical protein
MFVTLQARTPCWSCGYLHKVFRFSQIRVNKLSLKEQGVSLICAGEVCCPECGELSTSSSIPVSAWRLLPQDEAKVAAYRERKWGVTSRPGPLFETRRRAA